MALRFTRAHAVVLSDPSKRASLRVTRAKAELLCTASNLDLRRNFTGCYAQVIGTRNKTNNELKVTRTYINILAHRKPDFSWVDDMFVNEVFPYDISYNSIGATRFQTDVVVVDSGEDQRSGRWDQPLMEYNIAYGVRTMEQLHGLIAFFRAVRGRLYGFLYDDHVDDTSTLAVITETRRAPAISPTDQLLGTGDMKTKIFQLVKYYNTPTGAYSHVRTIQKPKPGSVLIALDGTQVANFTVDTDTGLVTFTSRVSINPGVPLSTILQSGGEYTISASQSLFSVFNANERIVMTGWVNAQNNVGENLVTRVGSVAADGKSMSVWMPDGYGMNETNVSGIKIYSNPAPDKGVQIAAGFGFYVPVRFDVDRLPVSLEYYGVGSANDLKLVEIRPNEATS